MKNQEVHYLVNVIRSMTIFVAFELVCHSLLPGRLPQWEHQVLQGWNERLQYSQPIGVWRSEFGLTDQGKWSHDSHIIVM